MYFSLLIVTYIVIDYVNEGKKKEKERADEDRFISICSLGRNHLKVFVPTSRSKQSSFVSIIHCTTSDLVDNINRTVSDLDMI